MITLASGVFRVLLPILPASLRFLRSALGLRWPSCLAPRPRCGCHLIGAHLRWGNRFFSWIRVRKGDYSRVKSVSSTSSDSSNEPAVFAHFWLRRGHMVLRPHLSCLTSRFTHVWSLYGFLGFFGVRQGYSCVGVDRQDDYSAVSSASLAQCGYGGSFFPNFAIFTLVWDHLRNFSFYS